MFLIIAIYTLANNPLISGGEKVEKKVNMRAYATLVLSDAKYFTFN